MITPPALPGHPFGKVRATGFTPRECAGLIGILHSAGPRRAPGEPFGKNVQVRAAWVVRPEMGAPGRYLPGAAPRYETHSRR